MFSARRQINVVAFVKDHTVAVGSANLPEGHPSVVPSSQEVLMQEFAGYGPDVLGVLRCINNPNKWYINVIHPPLQSYVKGRVALIGDAVSVAFVFFFWCMLLVLLKMSTTRPMGWSLIWVPEPAKASKTGTFSRGSSLIRKPPLKTSKYVHPTLTF